MKLSVNRNIIWCDLFVNRLSQLGVRYACISPGSRSTSLTLAFASNKMIKVFPIVDERSSAFFALGLAKKSNTPVAVVTTSGTAVAELYPAIIEAFYTRVPLIICTADRPVELRNRGANQTINQHNIYKNHIRSFIDAGLPELNKLSSIKKIAEEAIHVSCFSDRGPVHINFPFKKPFEPKSYTDQINLNKIEKVFTHSAFEIKPPVQSAIDYESLSRKIAAIERGLIIVGHNNYGKEFTDQVLNLSKKTGYPIFADGSSSFRFIDHSNNNLIDNLTAMVGTPEFQRHYDPGIIIQFGGAPTSNIILDFFKSSKAEKFLVHEFGDRNDPSLTAKAVLRTDPVHFCSSILNNLLIENRDSCWLIDLQVMNRFSEKLKKKLIFESGFPFEGRIINEIINAMPAKSNLTISNSLPIRDTDFFASGNNKLIKIFTNRGASGIDGVNSTALGIAAGSKEKNYLLIGDLAFYHDLNGLHNAFKYRIPLTVILINNGGGGIFESLPISAYGDVYRKNFSTPLNINFKNLVKAYDGNYYKINSWKSLREKVILSSRNLKLNVLEIQTDARKSKLQRQKYWNTVSKRIVRFINETKS
ncbi:MAG: 2-succinyl-5-enolpyruvyl-6-hydroxy-3-cyclohexene-1-carboxylic-acid synthase [Ignavibacteriae bacterium HGW-Ignavibacteriae-3]|nr:MAG: 2-succinyl-5-enolpyruvyl-6-hydroxy-3-cyclohexene-1-carboxylic-acid synthase [Ignavibacteriae bacterium HGW-Ignavibacteriae-3]